MHNNGPKTSTLEKAAPRYLEKILTGGPLNLRPAQRPPYRNDWLTWLILGGRGSGKTRAGSEWVHGLATGTRPFSKTITGPIALVGQTINDVREIMIDGPAGLRSCALFQRPSYESSRRRLVWPNGMVAHVFSAHDPESLRGPQFAAAWCDAKTIWAGLVSIAAAIAALVGFPIDEATKNILTESALQLVTAIAGFLAILGRISASTRIAGTF